MATEVIKLILGMGQSLAGRLLSYEAVTMHFDEVSVQRDPSCPLCGERPSIRDLSIHTESAPQVCALPNT